MFPFSLAAGPLVCYFGGNEKQDDDKTKKQNKSKIPKGKEVSLSLWFRGQTMFSHSGHVSLSAEEFSLFLRQKTQVQEAQKSERNGNALI